VRFSRIGSVAVALASVFAVATACEVPNQHTLVGISSWDTGRGGTVNVEFTFDQGLPSTVTARYVTTPPLQPNGQAVGVDGVLYVQVAFTPAVAHDSRGATTAPAAYYPTQRVSHPASMTDAKVAEVARYEDFEGYVGYVIGIKQGWGSDRHLRVVKSGDTVTVVLNYYG
jgi:hypothetical protein